VVTEGGAVRICFLGGGAIGGILAGHLATRVMPEAALAPLEPFLSDA
jgi:hypothetical protein